MPSEIDIIDMAAERLVHVEAALTHASRAIGMSIESDVPSEEIHIAEVSEALLSISALASRLNAKIEDKLRESNAALLDEPAHTQEEALDNEARLQTEDQVISISDPPESDGLDVVEQQAVITDEEEDEVTEPPTQPVEAQEELLAPIEIPIVPSEDDEPAIITNNSSDAVSVNPEPSLGDRRVLPGVEFIPESKPPLELIALLIELRASSGEWADKDALLQVCDERGMDLLKAELLNEILDYGLLIVQAEQELVWRENLSEELPALLDQQILENPFFDRANTAVQESLEEFGAKILPISFFVDRIAGGRLPKEDFRQLTKVLDAHPLLKYIGDGQYSLGGAQPEWEDEPDEQDMKDFVDAVMQEVGNVNRPMKTGGFLGVAKSLGRMLSSQEKDVFFRYVIEHERVVPQEDGGFFIKRDEAITDSKSAHSDSDGVEGTESKPLTGKQLNRAMAEARKNGDAMDAKRRRERGQGGKRKRGKNFRRKGSRFMGRNHGKKKSIDDLIAEMNKDDSEK